MDKGKNDTKTTYKYAAIVMLMKDLNLQGNDIEFIRKIRKGWRRSFRTNAAGLN